MTIALLSGEKRVCITSEAIIISERVDAYAWMILATVEMTPGFELSDIKVIYAYGIHAGETLLQLLGILMNCRIVLDHQHLPSGDIGSWPKFAARWHVKYLKGSNEKVMTHSPTKDWNLEVFGEKDIAETGTQKIEIRPGLDNDTLLAGRRILRKSWIQSEFTLSGTESEFAGSLYSIRNAIPTMDFKE
jgi:hypothetical protein